MATTTFSGPIKAGTIKIQQAQQLELILQMSVKLLWRRLFQQTLSGGALAAQVTDVVIPANSQIIDCVIDIITAANATTNLSIGDTVGGAATILNTFASGTDAGRVYPTTQAGAALAWQDTGTADIRLTVTASAATNAGLVRFTILYQQNNNLA